MQSLRGHSHRQKQPSKQELLLDSTDNENIRDSMAKIFGAFEDAQNNITRGSQDLTAIASGLGSGGVGRFTIDDHLDGGSPLRPSASHGDGGGADFWGNMAHDADDANRYSDDERFAMPITDFSGDVALQTL